MADSTLLEPTTVARIDWKMALKDLNRLYGPQMRNFRGLNGLKVCGQNQLALSFLDGAVVPAFIEDHLHHIEIIANGWEEAGKHLKYQPGRVSVLKADLPKGLLD